MSAESTEIYLKENGEWKLFTFSERAEIQPEFDKRNIQLPSNCRIGKKWRLGDGFTAGYGFKAGDGFTAGDGFKAGDEFNAGDGFTAGDGFKAGDWFNAGYGFTAGDGFQISNHIILPNSYKYIARGYLNEIDKKHYIQLGCYLRTIDEWDGDFWNNNDEFPEGSESGNLRFETFNKIKKYLLK